MKFKHSHSFSLPCTTVQTFYPRFLPRGGMRIIITNFTNILAYSINCAGNSGTVETKLTNILLNSRRKLLSTHSPPQTRRSTLFKLALLPSPQTAAEVLRVHSDDKPARHSGVRVKKGETRKNPVGGRVGWAASHACEAGN